MDTKFLYTVGTCFVMVATVLSHYLGFPKTALIFLILTAVLSVVGMYLWEYGKASRKLFLKTLGRDDSHIKYRNP